MAIVVLTWQFLLLEWLANRWQLLAAELVAILALAYIVQASGL
jgi:hypothetical protein